ncbi:MAG: DNA mismatch endonuclease Vsr [Sulfitobacter sp. SK025]|nr:MAG: DNA mismatch endonuclease Vsr [Sulfitobacter sp. SK025]
MRAVKSADTGPEMIVRRLLHKLGYRYRLHRKDLPGKPDLVFPSRKAAIFVHGCFWHGHDCKRGARTPKTNTAYWTNKIRHNVERDTKAINALKAAEWRVFVIWECELRDLDRLRSRSTAFLDKRP